MQKGHEDMKLTPNQLKKIIIEELRHLREEDEFMTDDDAGGILSLLPNDFEMGLEILQSFEHKNLSPEAEMSLAQAIWGNTIGFDEDPKWLTLRDAVIEAEKTGFYYKIAGAEAEANKYNMEIKGRIDRLASSLGMRDIDLNYELVGVDSLPKFLKFLKEQGLL